MFQQSNLDKIQEKIAKLERLKQKVNSMQAKIARDLEIAAPPAATPELTISSGGRCQNVWPKSSEWGKATFQVLEVTGKRDGYYVPGVWFRVDEWERAKEHLENNLNKGNIWVSQAWAEDNNLFTGARKRVATK